MTLPPLTRTKARPPVKYIGQGRWTGKGRYGDQRHRRYDDNRSDDEPGRTWNAGWPSKRISPWPFLLVLGLVLASVGLILAEWSLNVMGVVFFVLALGNWIRDVCADFSRLPD